MAASAATPATPSAIQPRRGERAKKSSTSFEIERPAHMVTRVKRAEASSAPQRKRDGRDTAGGMTIIGAMLAGWSSSNKFSMLGALRAGSQMISYELVMGLTVLGLILVYGTLDLGSIVNQQSGHVGVLRVDATTTVCLIRINVASGSGLIIKLSHF